MATTTASRRSNNAPKLVELIPAAAYVRMSTDRQEDSPERQKRQINEYATKHGYNVIRWYADHGMSGTESANRAGYQQLLEESRIGAFSAVLIAELSRLSREDLFSVLPQWGAFRDAGITLVSCQRGVIDFSSMGGFLSAIIDQYSAHDESKKFADRTVTGKLNRIMNGERVSGNRLFGFDRNIVDRSGNVLKRVSFREQFIKSVDCHSILVPSAESEAVKAVKWAYDHILNGGSVVSVAKEFNRRGLVGVQGKQFHTGTARLILTNPSYAGMTRAAYKCRGKFSRMSDTQEPILMENTHAGIVDRQTFETVSTMIENRAVRKDKWLTYLLSGLCRCGHCGHPLAGQNNSNGVQVHRYTCYMNKSMAKRTRREPCVVLPAFDGPILERAVIRAWCDVFLIDDVAEQLKLKPAEDASKHEQAELRTIGEQISRAETNLALAGDGTDFKTVSKVLSQLRKRESELRDKLSKAGRRLADLAPEILAAVKSFKDSRAILEDWPNVGTEQELNDLRRDLAVVMKQTISGVVLRTENVNYKGSCGNVKNFRRRTGVVTFNNEHISAPDAILTDDMLAHPYRRQYRKVVEVLRLQGRPMKSQELADVLNKEYSAIRRALVICEHEGLVRRLGGKVNAGWTVCE